MSPPAKRAISPRIKGILLTGAALVSAVLVITGPIATGAKAVDARYVKQQSYDRKAERDSLSHDYELQKIDAKLARMDTNLTCLRRPLTPGC